MKIAINTRFLLTGKLEGIGWFTFESVKRMVLNHPEHQFYFLFDRPYDKQFIFSDNVTPIVLFPPARHPFLWFWWFEFSVYRTLKEIKPDIFLSTDGYLSLRSKIKSIPVIHDLNFEHHPNTLKWLIQKYYLYFFPRFARRANRIITVSEYSKQDIVNLYKVDANKIDVAYNGANTIYKPLNDTEKQLAREEFASGNPYFIYIGALLPRKNIARMLEAFDRFKETTHSDIKMLIVGSKMFNTGDIEQAYSSMKHHDDVIFTGRLSPGKIEKAMGGALALTYVSYFEGFGIPLIEAMYADVPVITSDKTALPEVAGDAALIVDPFSIQSIASAMNEMYSNQTLRNMLIDKGKIQRQKFTWDNTAKQVWESIEKCVKQ